jgi:probable FeS assembly SUF system protein SufT
MEQFSSVELRRDCEAVQIPAGTTMILPAGTLVHVTQTLGGSYTVQGQGGLFRIAAKDADALGMAAVEKPAAEAGEGVVSEEQVWETLRTCYDPEIPVNIVDLGLVYDVQVNEDQVAVKMTLTAPGCGMGTFIANDARQKILQLDEVTDAHVDLVWDPPWNPSMMSEEARLKLGIG